jgi:LPXTG-site transpeptidase (sortase) family protein
VTATATPTATQVPGRLHGVVFNDIDADGIQDPGELGIPGVTVTLYDDLGGVVGTQITLADGSYSFDNLTAGDYTVVETDPAGYISTTNNSVDATVPPGGDVEVNFGDRQISGGEPAWISGTVWDDVDDDAVMDVGEIGIPGVLVELLDSGGGVIASTLTASDGTYSFLNLPAGIYTVRETDPAGYVSTTPNQVTVTLSEGEHAIVDFGDRLSTGVLFADPAVTKYSDPSSAQIGDLVTFTMTVTNVGNIDATDVVVTDAKPAFLDILSVNITPGPGFPTTIVGNTITITFGSLAPGETYTVTVVTRVNALATPPGGTNYVTLTTSSTTDDPDNNDDDADVVITTPVTTLPDTGFAPGVVSPLPVQPPEESYTLLDDLTLSIPKLGVRVPIVGVPQSDSSWNVDWLWNQAGWLNGTAFPTWTGNSVITGHVYLPSGLPGPFVNLYNLSFNDTVIVAFGGRQYIYKVRSVLLVRPGDLSILRHETLSWLTLITCRSYSESSDSYRWRVAVRSVLMEVR